MTANAVAIPTAVSVTMDIAHTAIAPGLLVTTRKLFKTPL